MVESRHAGFRHQYRKKCAGSNPARSTKYATMMKMVRRARLKLWCSVMGV